MTSTNSPRQFLSQAWTNRSTDPDPEPSHSRRGKRPGPSDVSRSWHAGCPAADDRGPIQSHSYPGPMQYGFGALFRTGPLPSLPVDLVPGTNRPTTAPFLLTGGRLASPGTPNRMRNSAGGTGKVSNLW
ncbi:unnamed protein product [Echinostoma caproni]|uniref:ODF3 n=1 Tax=Echinostoma caproni TaxID=27848 RepID=A0A183AI77_9TREM|nr:unnamed protein product [Echinostoma caproni]